MAHVKVNLLDVFVCLRFEIVCKASKHLFKVCKTMFKVDLVDMTYTLDVGRELSQYFIIS